MHAVSEQFQSSIGAKEADCSIVGRETPWAKKCNSSLFLCPSRGARTKALVYSLQLTFVWKGGAGSLPVHVKQAKLSISLLCFPKAFDSPGFCIRIGDERV